MNIVARNYCSACGTFAISEWLRTRYELGFRRIDSESRDS